MKYDYEISLVNKIFIRIQKKIYAPVTDTIKITSELLTKTLFEYSNKKSQSLENLNDKLSEKLDDRGILPS